MPVPRATFDLRDPAFVADPYAALARARGQAPVLWHEGLGLWVTTTHAAANDVLRDRRLGRILRPRSSGDDGWTTFDWLHADSILDSEPPKHTRLRRLVAGAFARGHVARLRPRVEEVAAGLLDEVERVLERDGRVDVIADLCRAAAGARHLRAARRARRADWKLLRDWSQAIVRMYEVDPDPSTRSGTRSARARSSRHTSSALAAERAERARATTCSPRSCRSVTAVTGSRRASSSRRSCCCSTRATRRASTASATASPRCSQTARPARRRAAAARRRRPPSSGSSRRCCGTTRRCTSSSAPRRPTSSSTASRSAAAQKVAALLGAANRDPAVFAEPDRFVRRPRPQPAPRLRRRHPLLPRGAAGPDGAADLDPGTAPAARTARGRRRGAPADVRAARLRAPRRASPPVVTEAAHARDRPPIEEARGDRHE